MAYRPTILKLFIFQIPTGLKVDISGFYWGTDRVICFLLFIFFHGCSKFLFNCPSRDWEPCREALEGSAHRGGDALCLSQGCFRECKTPPRLFLNVDFCVALSPSKWNKNINVDIKAIEMPRGEILIFWVDELFAL